jgi:hypothetical protein
MRTIAGLIVLSVVTSTESIAGIGAVSSLPALATASALVDRIDYRRCWRRNGERHCRWVTTNNEKDNNSVPAYGAGSPESYRVGTAEWWRAMEREGRLSRDRSD